MDIQGFGGDRDGLWLSNKGKEPRKKRRRCALAGAGKGDGRWIGDESERDTVAGGFKRTSDALSMGK